MASAASDGRLRKARLEDAEPLAELKLATFRETFLGEGFAIPYPPKELAKFEADAYSVDRAVADLCDPQHATWIIDARAGFLAYAHIGPCKLPHAEVKTEDGELIQLYVRKRAQGLGFGGRLLDHALAHLAAVRPGPVWLGAWSGNHRAHAVYEQRGFKPVGGYGFRVGSWVDDEIIFRRG